MKTRNANKQESTCEPNKNLGKEGSIIIEPHLREFDSIRREIELHIELEERMLANLLLIIGALLSASQLFNTQATQLIDSMNNNPYIYLLLSSICLVFPMTVLHHDLYVTTLGGYVRSVLSPKISYILQTQSSKEYKQYHEWETSNYPREFRGYLRWEYFRPQSQFRSTVPLYGAIAMFRFLFVSAPSLFLFCIFFVVNSKNSFWIGWSTTDQVTFILMCILIIIIFISIIIGMRSYSGFAYKSFKNKS